MEVNGFGRFAAAASQFVQGDRVVIHGKPNLWMKRTSLSLRGDTILKVGAGGSLKAMIDELRKQLRARACSMPITNCLSRSFRRLLA